MDPVFSCGVPNEPFVMHITPNCIIRIEDPILESVAFTLRGSNKFTLAILKIRSGNNA